MQGTAVFLLLHQACGVIHANQRVGIQLGRSGPLLHDFLIHLIG